ncbi:tyrosine-type recombinase/integrase [Azospirillum brasilense]|nr:tyrosine-type recombinase/integrase [Azospirillum brasilense]
MQDTPKEGVERRELGEGLMIWRDAKSPFWQMRAYVPGTRRYVRQSLKTADEHKAIVEARKRWMRVQVRMEDNLPIFELRIEKACDLWIKHAEKLEEKGEFRPAVLYFARGTIKRYLKAYFGTRPLSSIDHGESDRYWRWRIENGKQGKSPRKVTLSMELTVINQIIEWAEIQGHVKRALIPRLKLPKPLAKRKQERRAAFSAHEMDTLFAMLKLWQGQGYKHTHRMTRMVLYYAVRLVYLSGMRTNDLPLLRWRDVRETWSERDQHWYVELYLRGKVEPGWVVALPDARKYLLEWRELSPCTDPDDLVFSFERDKEGRSKFPGLESSFRLFLKENNLWKDADGEQRSLYSLRHTYATEALKHGVPIEDLARNMRTSVSMIVEHYGHVTNLEKAKVLTQRPVTLTIDPFAGLLEEEEEEV